MGSTPPPERPRILHALPEEYAIAAWTSVVTAVVRARPTDAFLRGLHAGLRSAAAMYPTGVYLMLVKEMGSGLPEGKTRELAHEMFRDMGPHFAGVAGIVEGSGFWAAATRSVMSVAVRMGQKGFPFRIFASVHEGASWMSITSRTSSAVRLSSGDIEALASSARAAMDEPHQRMNGTYG